MLGLAHPPLAQTQFQERAVKGYFSTIPDTTDDLVAADIDGDGDLDVLTANGFHGARLYLNDGWGVLVDVTETHLPPLPLTLHRKLGIGDIDGDGDLDALFTSGKSASSNPLLLVNDGTGHFSDETVARVPVAALRDTSRPLFGDVDGDSDLDLVAPNQGGPAGLFLNDGLGFFTEVSASRMPTSNNTNGEAALADVDADLDLDLVLANASQDRLYLNDGFGFFTDVTDTHLPVEQGYNFPKAMVLVDVDLDLDLDMVIGDGAASFAEVLRLNNGAGVFTDASSNLPSFPMTVKSLVAGDVNGDLNPDLVFGNVAQSRLFLGNGSGVFVDAPFPLRSPERDEVGGLALVDFDSDGDLDLLMGRVGIDRLYMNDGVGGFTNTAAERIAWSQLIRPAALELVDLDLDGDLDLIFGAGQFRGFEDVGATYFNDGTGAFPTRSIIPSVNPVALATGDVDGDADPDVLVGAASLCFLGYGCSSTYNQLLLNDGSGGLTKATFGALPFDRDDTFAVELADVDGDSDLDAVFGNWQQQNRLYLNDGLGTFTDVTTVSLPVRTDRTRALALGDFDGDGDLDIIVGNDGEQSLMYVNEGFGTFVDRTEFRMPALSRRTRALGVGDLNNDGHLDLVLGNDGQPGLYLNNGSGRLLDYTDYMPQQTEETWALQLSDVDEDGDLDVVLGNRSPSNDVAQNRLLLNDGTGRFSDSGRLPDDLDRTAALAIGDIDGDLDPDLLAGSILPSLTTVPQNRVYLNLHRQLGAPLLPILGRTYEIKFDSEPGYGTAPRTGIVAFSYDLLPAPIPIASIQGELALLPDFFFTASTAIPSPSGSQVIKIPVPNNLALLGPDFYVQGLILGGGSPANFTGYLRETFGL